MEILRKDEANDLLPVIRLEIDYELMALHDALSANDTVGIIRAKERLKLLRLKLLEIENG